MCGKDQLPPRVPYRTQAFLLATVPTAAAATNGEYVSHEFPVKFKGYTYKSWIAYKKGAEKRPVILVFPNYAGLKQFDKDQAVFLAKLGYVGLAVDLYKETPDYKYEDRNPTPNYQEIHMMEALQTQQFNEQQAKGLAHVTAGFKHYHGCLKQKADWRGLMQANLEEAKQHPSVHPHFAGAIGYCFGGQCVLECVRMGLDLQAVVSFHGILHSEPENVLGDPNFDPTVNSEGCVDNHTKGCCVVIENAELDAQVTLESIEKFANEMNEAGVNWRINHHAQAKHGFALPPGVWATEYDEVVDRRSTNSMISVFAEAFPDFPIQPVERNAAGSRLGQHITPRSRL